MSAQIIADHSPKEKAVARLYELLALQKNWNASLGVRIIIFLYLAVI